MQGASKPLLTTLALATIILLAGCTTPTQEAGLPGEYVIAFSLKDDHKNTDKDPALLAEFLGEQLGRPVKLYDVQDHGASTQALRFGNAHAAFYDGGSAWLAWKMYDVGAIAADQNSDGRTYYTAQAWVKADSPIQSLQDLEGVDSCHTGWLKSAGMLMPMGYLIANDIAPIVGDPTDILSLQDTVDGFFDNARVPEPGDPYYNYDGAMKCISEDAGDVAFVKDTTWHDYCEGDDARDWCLPLDQYRKLEPAFGNVPSHPVMVSPKLSQEARDALQAALLKLNDSDEGRSILKNVLETDALTAVTTQDHLGSYGAALEHIPGLQEYYADEYAFPKE